MLGAAVATLCGAWVAESVAICVVAASDVVGEGGGVGVAAIVVTISSQLPLLTKWVRAHAEQSPAASQVVQKLFTAALQQVVRHEAVVHMR